MMRSQFLQSPRLGFFGRRGGVTVDPFAAYAVSGLNPALVADFENDVFLGTLAAYSDLSEIGSPTFDTVVGARRLTLDLGTDQVNIPAALLPIGTAYSFAISGEITYADTNVESFQPYRWWLNSTNYIRTLFSTTGGQTGLVTFAQRESASGLDSVNSSATAISPGTNVPFSIASRHGATFINGAVDQDVRTANTTPTALFNGSAFDLNLGFHNAGTLTLRLRRFLMWNEDIGDAGLGDVTAPFG